MTEPHAIYTCRHGTLNTPCPECHSYPQDTPNVGGPAGSAGPMIHRGPVGIHHLPSFERQVLTRLTNLEEQLQALQRGTSAGVFAPTYVLPSISGVPGEVLAWTTREGVQVVNAQRYREALEEIERLRAQAKPGSAA